MKSLLFTAGLSLAAFTSAFAANPFVPASNDPLIGDWQSNAAGAPVAQLALDAHQDYQLNLLQAFDGGADTLLATLRGKPREGDSLKLRGSGWQARVEGEKLLLSRDGATHELTRVVRASPTLGAKPPAGAVVLFSGGSFAGWTKKKGKDWLSHDGPPPWTLTADGAMEVVPGSDSIITEREFGDCRLHLEFRTLGTPTNSGVYLLARYEIDINESFGRTDGNPCGSLGNCSTVKPSLRAGRAPLEWQTLDIDFKAPRFDAAGKKIAPARATVVLNGVTLYADQELDAPKGAAGRLGEAPTGPLLLQEHGAPLQFRNIWLVPSR